MSRPRNKYVFRCDQNAPPARREEGAYPERYVTDEQRSRRPIFIATLRAAASWLFFRVARSSRIGLDMLVTRASKNSQLTCGERHAYFGDRTLGFVLMWIRIRAVIIEDEPLAAQYLAALLDETCQVEVIGSAIESEAGLRLCAELRPDAVFVDINLPGKDGVSLACLRCSSLGMFSKILRT